MSSECQKVGACRWGGFCVGRNLAPTRITRPSSVLVPTSVSARTENADRIRAKLELGVGVTRPRLLRELAGTMLMVAIACGGEEFSAQGSGGKTASGGSDASLGGAGGT